MTRPRERVIVSGSRWYKDRQHVYDTLDRVYLEVGPLILVNGDCPARKDGTPGADQLARGWLAWRGGECRWQVEEELHPAPWYDPCRPSCRPGHRTHGGRSCPAAGVYRNIEMGDLGARYLVAFPLPGGSGTQQMISCAKAKGIPLFPVDVVQ